MGQQFEHDMRVANGVSGAEYFRFEERGKMGRLKTLQAMAGDGSSGSGPVFDMERLREFEEREEKEERRLRERQEREYDRLGDWEERVAALERRKLDLAQFRAVLRAGGFASVHLMAEGPVFQVEMVKVPTVVVGKQSSKATRKGMADVDDRLNRLVLVTTKGRKIVQFRNPRQPLTLLHAIGVTEVRIELGSWRPKMRGDLTRRRPDLAELLLFAHEYGRAVTES